MFGEENIMEKIVYSDCDGVVAYFEKLRSDFIHQRHPKLKDKEMVHYFFRDYGFSKEEIRAFFGSEKYARILRNMAPIQGAIEGLNTLYEDEEIDEVNILTYRDSYYGIEDDTSGWFEFEGGKYHNLFFTEDKGGFIKGYKDGLLIEDNLDNIKGANAIGVPGILIPYYHNTEAKEGPLLRIRNWVNDGSRKSSLVECIQNEFDWKNMKFKD
jgi:uncharacterized HAD superfamily protein